MSGDIHDEKNFLYIDPYILENNILVDVGSNNGLYTEFFKNKLNNTGKIYSIEVFPETCNELHKKFNNDNNIVIINKAVSNIDGKIPYYKGMTENTNNILGYDVNYVTSTNAGEIESIRLDTLLKEHEQIDLIKIDVEGAEYSVLDGIKNIINKVKYILVECHFDEEWEKIRNLLLNEYKLSCINISTNEIINLESNKPYQCFCKQK